MWLCAKLIAWNTFPEYQYIRKCLRTSRVTVYSNEWGRAPYPNNNVSMNSLVANGQNANPWLVQGLATW